MLNRLNGYQRLWVLVSVLWVLPVAVISFTGFPSTLYNFSRWQQSEVVSQMRNPQWDQSGCPSNWGYDERTQFSSRGQGRYRVEAITFDSYQVRFVDIPNDDFVVLCFATEATDKEVTAVAQDYQQAYLSALRNRQRGYLGWASAAVLLPPTCLYLFGAAIGWVIRGFRKQKKA